MVNKYNKKRSNKTHTTKRKKFKNAECTDNMTFQECEMAILRHNVDENEEIQGRRVVNNEDVKKMLQFLKTNNIIRDYALEAYADSLVKGKIYFDINLTSSLGLRKISFSISSGQGA